MQPVHLSFELGELPVEFTVLFALVAEALHRELLVYVVKIIVIVDFLISWEQLPQSAVFSG